MAFQTFSVRIPDGSTMGLTSEISRLLTEREYHYCEFARKGNDLLVTVSGKKPMYFLMSRFPGSEFLMTNKQQVDLFWDRLVSEKEKYKGKSVYLYDRERLIFRKVREVFFFPQSEPFRSEFLSFYRQTYSMYRAMRHIEMQTKADSPFFNLTFGYLVDSLSEQPVTQPQFEFLEEKDVSGMHIHDTSLFTASEGPLVLQKKRSCGIENLNSPFETAVV